MTRYFHEELRAEMLSGAGDVITVQLHWQQTGGLGLGIASRGFDEGRYPSPSDIMRIGGMLCMLGSYANRPAATLDDERRPE